MCSCMQVKVRKEYCSILDDQEEELDTAEKKCIFLCYSNKYLNGHKKEYKFLLDSSSYPKLIQKTQKIKKHQMITNLFISFLQTV